MKTNFAEFYLLTDQEFKKLWNECIFIFDSNVLLNLYRYSQQTSQKLLEVLDNEKIKNRIWIPHQFAFEYQKNRLDVIAEQKQKYEDVLKVIDSLTVEKYSRHPFLKMKRIMQSAKNQIKKKLKNHPDWGKIDPIREKLTELFDGKVGNSYLPDELNKRYEEGEGRYSKKIPPGYKDSKKAENRFGDYLGWIQIIDKAKSDKKPIIFITDDKEEDWWWIVKGEIVGPRFELRKELKESADVLFYMYDSTNFLKYSSEYLDQEFDKKAADEIEEVIKKSYIKKDAPINQPLEAEGLAQNVGSGDVLNIINEDVGISGTSSENK